MTATAATTARLHRPGDGFLDGPLAALSLRWSDWFGTPGVHLLYVSLDLAERADLVRSLGSDVRLDTEDAALVLAAYRRWGDDAAAHLNGQFAFAVWDGNRQMVIAARDAFGMRPLVYAKTRDGLVLGGDLRAVLASEGVSDSLDQDLLIATMVDRNSYLLTELGRTCYADVNTLRPGHLLLASADAARQLRYWNAEDVPDVRFKNLVDYVNALRCLYEQVMDEYTPRDEVLGTHLTGGVDSSGVTALAALARARAGSPPPVAFCWEPPPDNGRTDEHDCIESVAERYNLPLVYAPPTEDDVLANLRRDATREPHELLLHESAVLRLATERGVTMILSGWGGDEGVSFKGHGVVERHLIRSGRWMPLWRLACRERGGWRRIVSAGLLNRAVLPDYSLEQKRKLILDGKKESFLEQATLKRARFPSLSRQPSDPYSYMRWLLSVRGAIATRTDAWARAGAEHGIRYRYPFLDLRLVRFAMGLPAEMWLHRNGRHRWLVREMLRGLVDDRVRFSRKSDPTRCSFVLGLLRQVHANCAESLRSELPKTERGRFLDQGRLQAELTPEALEKRTKWGPIRSVLDYIPLSVT